MLLLSPFLGWVSSQTRPEQPAGATLGAGEPGWVLLLGEAMSWGVPVTLPSPGQR